MNGLHSKSMESEGSGLHLLRPNLKNSDSLKVGKTLRKTQSVVGSDLALLDTHQNWLLWFPSFSFRFILSYQH